MVALHDVGECLGSTNQSSLAKAQTFRVLDQLNSVLRYFDINLVILGDAYMINDDCTAKADAQARSKRQDRVYNLSSTTLTCSFSRAFEWRTSRRKVHVSKQAVGYSTRYQKLDSLALPKHHDLL